MELTLVFCHHLLCLFQCKPGLGRLSPQGIFLGVVLCRYSQGSLQKAEVACRKEKSMQNSCLSLRNEKTWYENANINSNVGEQFRAVTRAGWYVMS